MFDFVSLQKANLQWCWILRMTGISSSVEHQAHVDSNLPEEPDHWLIQPTADLECLFGYRVPTCANTGFCRGLLLRETGSPWTTVDQNSARFSGLHTDLLASVSPHSCAPTRCFKSDLFKTLNCSKFEWDIAGVSLSCSVCRGCWTRRGSFNGMWEL